MAFPTPLLDARIAREKKQNEADRQRLLPATVKWLEENAARYGIDRGYVFGSVTECDRFTQYSDTDLAVETHNADRFIKEMTDPKIRRFHLDSR